jgi:hypothetical protein
LEIGDWRLEIKKTTDDTDFTDEFASSTNELPIGACHSENEIAGAKGVRRNWEGGEGSGKLEGRVDR